MESLSEKEVEELYVTCSTLKEFYKEKEGQIHFSTSFCFFSRRSNENALSGFGGGAVRQEDM